MKTEDGEAKRPHPEPTELERFLRGELGREEVRLVVRHLLTRCPRCLAAAQPLWRAGAR